MMAILRSLGLSLALSLLLVIGSEAWMPRRTVRSTPATIQHASTPDTQYYSSLDLPTTPSHGPSQPRITLSRYLAQAVEQNPALRDLEYLYMAVQMACKTISNLVNRAGLSKTETSTGLVPDDSNYTDGRYYSMKRLDQLSTLVLQNALRFTGKCNVHNPKSIVETEEPHKHQPGVLIAQSRDSNYIACLDPLDGSGNADASICTGTVFGVFEKEADATQKDLVDAVLQPAKNMRAAGYCLYSSATVLVLTLGDSVQGFTLDNQMQEFVLTHPNLTIPKRGSVYSCNEANSEGWDESYKTYLRNLKTGKGESGQRYAHRYVGSMVGDIHRTLLYGGLFAYPADSLTHPNGNLQLLYKTAPMAFVVSTAGGKAIDGRNRSLLEVRPERIHQKSPCFLGSPDDVEELEGYLTQATIR